MVVAGVTDTSLREMNKPRSRLPGTPMSVQTGGLGGLIMPSAAPALYIHAYIHAHEIYMSLMCGVGF